MIKIAALIMTGLLQGIQTVHSGPDGHLTYC